MKLKNAYIHFTHTGATNSEYHFYSTCYTSQVNYANINNRRLGVQPIPDAMSH